MHWTLEALRDNGADQGEAVHRGTQSRSPIPKSSLLNGKHLGHGIWCMRLTTSQEVGTALLVSAFYREYVALHKSPLTSPLK